MTSSILFAPTLVAAFKPSLMLSFELADTTIVDTTLTEYPKDVPCRIDTFHNALLGRERPRCWFAPR